MTKPTAPSTSAEDTEDEDDAEGDSADAAEASAEKAQADFEKRLARLQAAVLKLSKKAGPTAVRRDQDFQEARVALDEQLADLERAAQKRCSPATRTRRPSSGSAASWTSWSRKPSPVGGTRRWPLVLSIYGALSVVQAAVIALSRDYHAAIARDASLLLGVAPEDPPLEPRVRLNVAWIRRKLKQRTRSLLVFLPGVALITVAAFALPGADDGDAASSPRSGPPTGGWCGRRARAPAPGSERASPGRPGSCGCGTASLWLPCPLWAWMTKALGEALGATHPVRFLARRGGGGAAGGVRRAWPRLAPCSSSRW